MSTSAATQSAKYRYRITKIHFNDGSSPEPGNLVVFVGPNNAGKSRSLRGYFVHMRSRYMRGEAIATNC
jgi:ABC-type hemin transport system ATPase subunit